MYCCETLLKGLDGHCPDRVTHCRQIIIAAQIEQEKKRVSFRERRAVQNRGGCKKTSREGGIAIEVEREGLAGYHTVYLSYCAGV